MTVRLSADSTGKWSISRHRHLLKAITACVVGRGDIAYASTCRPARNARDAGPARSRVGKVLLIWALWGYLLLILVCVIGVLVYFGLRNSTHQRIKLITKNVVSRPGTRRSTRYMKSNACRMKLANIQKGLAITATRKFGPGEWPSAPAVANLPEKRRLSAGQLSPTIGRLVPRSRPSAEGELVVKVRHGRHGHDRECSRNNSRGIWPSPVAGVIFQGTAIKQLHRHSMGGSNIEI